MQYNNKTITKFVIGICLIITTIVITFVITNTHYNSQFRVTYSLDDRHNDQEIIRVIDNAQKYVYFAIYYFTRSNIADALIRAQKRGLVVWGITDAEASKGSNRDVLASLKKAGIAVETQKHQDGIMHLKVLVTDKAYASGSYNWTTSATEANDEVLEIGTNKSVRQQYLDIVKRVLLVNQDPI